MKRASLAVLTGCLLALALAACGGSGSKEPAAGEELSIDTFFNSSNPSGGAQIGYAGCAAGEKSINAAGGVLGHKVKCVHTDAGGDPSDAVPAVAKMLATTSNLVLVLGPQEVAAATEPIIGKYKIPMMSLTGDPHFNFNTDPYFYRLVSGDDVGAEAQAYWAITKSGYKRVAMLFEGGAGASDALEALKQAIKKLGGQLTANLLLAPNQSSYRSEVQTLRESKPEAILTETEGTVAAVFFSELLELNNDKMIPIEGTGLVLAHEYVEPLEKAIGVQKVKADFVGTNVAATVPGPAVTEYQKYLKTVGSEVREPEQYANYTYASTNYDADVLCALAMTAANSVIPAKFNPYIAKLTGQPEGRTVVHTYAEGLAALKQHKNIVYLGTTGPIMWNSHHTLEGNFEAQRYEPANKSFPLLGTITAATLKKVKELP